MKNRIRGHHITIITFLFSFFFFNFASAQTDRTVTYRDTSYQGKYISQTEPDPIVMAPGEVKDVTITFKNTGQSSWSATGKHYVTLYTVNPRYIASNFADTSWIANNNPAKISKNAKTGQNTDITIRLHAPKREATYKEEFTLAVENSTWIKGSYFYLLIKVVSPEQPSTTVEAAHVSTTPPSTTTDGVTVNDAVTPTRELITEPRIRVGLYTTKDVVRFSSAFVYDVESGGENKGTIAPGELVTLSYDGSYHLVSQNVTLDSPSFIRLVPRDNDSYFTLLNYDHRVVGRGSTNYNVFRGTFEYRVNKKREAYAINELPLEQYVASIAETSNDSAPEYLKALMTAARTYAYVRMAPVSDAHIFDVVPTSADQIYLGYYSEALMPNVVLAAQNTAGMMVTYHGNPVMTNYFGHSDGRTRDGAANRPWLRSVKAVYDKGLIMYGHGVGMSAHDAAMHADKDGWTFEEILKYYYTGVEIERVY